MPGDLSRRALCRIALSSNLVPPDLTRYSFSVLRLLYPHRLIIRPLRNGRLHCIGGHSTAVVERGSFSVSPDVLSGADNLWVTGPGESPVDFLLEIPDVMQRSYRGLLHVSGDGEVLQPQVTMDCETATGSVVGAELPVSAAPFQALAAQAVVSRSFILGGTGRPRHTIADFCDTTHCQFLRSPSPSGSLVERAVSETAGIILQQEGRILSARYSGACGGATEGGLKEGTYYSSVQCEPCQMASRMRRGHGWGLCQQGAMDLARSGVRWAAILAIYYPRAEIRWQAARVAAKSVGGLKHL